MGENLTLFGAEFNSSVRIESRDERITSDAGVVLLREIIERLGLIPWLVERLHDSRNPDLITHPLAELIRSEVLLLAQGWRDEADADTLRHDPVFRLAVSDRKGVSPLVMRPQVDGVPLSKNPAVPDGLASQPTLSRLSRMLSQPDNLAVLQESLLFVAAQRNRNARAGHRHRHLTIDIDGLPIEVHGHQPGSAHNGHYQGRIYHPLMALAAETGDILDLRLREGNAHTANGALSFILQLVERVERDLCQVASIRMDAGFPEDGLLSGLEARKTPYAARIRNNPVLDRMAEPYLVRPPGRPPQEPRTWLYEMEYRANEWSRSRRVVLVVLERADEFFLHHFWLLTNWDPTSMPAEELLALYRQRGTAEGHFGELLDVLDPLLSSTPRPKSHYRGVRLRSAPPAGDSFAQNTVRLLLNALAYNIMHVGRVLLAQATGCGWSLRGFRERILRVAARVLIHARQAVVVIAKPAAACWRLLWSLVLRLSPSFDTS
jgi:Transposase DDE domain group 1